MTETAMLSTPPRQSAGVAPVRKPGSARRTSSIDVSWPEGRAGNMRMVGRARDVVTLVAGKPIICAEDGFEAFLSPDRRIVSIEAQPPRADLSRLVGERGGGGLRRALEQVIPDERHNATPLYLILDDIAGASLVAGWAWSQWDPNWLENSRAALKGFDLEKAFRSREGICSGFVAGSSAFSPSTNRSGTATTDLRNPDDLEGWHAYSEQDGSIAMRRARRIDVWLNQSIIIDSAFQDSATTAAGGRAVVHEYRLTASADPVSLRLQSIAAEARVLPFVECPMAARNLDLLLDTSLPELRDKVLVELKGTAGCTHLNDALRALAEVPLLVQHLRGALR